MQAVDEAGETERTMFGWSARGAGERVRDTGCIEDREFEVPGGSGA